MQCLVFGLLSLLLVGASALDKPSRRVQPPIEEDAPSETPIPVVKPASLEEDPDEPPTPYLFTYDITDDENNKQFRKESSDGSAIRGSYGYTDANGLYRLVEYVADAKHGFRAKVKSNEPGMENVGLGGSEHIASASAAHTSSGDGFRFDNVNLESGSAGSTDQAEQPSRGWPANVYLELLQPPTQLLQRDNQRRAPVASTSTTELDDEPDAALSARQQPSTSAAVPTATGNVRSVVGRNHGSHGQLRHQPHQYKAAASVGRSASIESPQSPPAVAAERLAHHKQPKRQRQTLYSENPAVSGGGLVRMSDHSKRAIKQLLQASRSAEQTHQQRGQPQDQPRDQPIYQPRDQQRDQPREQLEPRGPRSSWMAKPSRAVQSKPAGTTEPLRGSPAAVLARPQPSEQQQPNRSNSASRRRSPPEEPEVERQPGEQPPRWTATRLGGDDQLMFSFGSKIDHQPVRASPQPSKLLSAQTVQPRQPIETGDSDKKRDSIAS